MAVTGGQCGDFTIFQVGIARRDSLENNTDYKHHFRYVVPLSIRTCRGRPKDSKTPGQVQSLQKNDTKEPLVIYGWFCKIEYFDKKHKYNYNLETQFLGITVGTQI